MITPLDILSVESWILLISAIVLIRLYIHKKWQVFKNLNIPYESPSLLGLGNLGPLMKDPDAFFKRDFELKKKFGKVFGMYSGLAPRICISDPNILKQIFIKEFSNFRDRQDNFRKINGKVMNTSMTAVSGDQWKRIRNTLSPIFSTHKLKEMAGILEGCVDQMTSRLNSISENGDGRFSPKELFGKLSMDVICSAAFSVNVHSQDAEEGDAVKYGKKLFSRGVLDDPFIIMFLLFPWTEKIAEKLNYSVFNTKIIDYFKRLVDVLIKNKQSGGKQRMDIMQHMLKYEMKEEDVNPGTEKGITRTEIAGNSIIMILAGYETTANTLLFMAYCLATNKKIQAKLQEEIDDSVEDGGLSYERIKDMKYLDMCMKESQRLYGAIPRNNRYCENDITINGIHIPAGTNIDVPIYGMSHDEEYWDEPWEYKPERFEDMSKIDPMIFQPFGAGPRNCIGMRFAIMVVKMAIAKILLNFNLDVCEDTPAPPLDVTFKGSLQPKEEVFLKVVPK